MAELRAAVAASPDPNAHHLLGSLLFIDDDLLGARHEWEHAYHLWADAGESRRAAMVAADLADLFVSGLGNRVVGDSWQQRGYRTLEAVGRCVETGYVDLALIACDCDPLDLENASANAAALAEEFGDRELAILAMANAGYARVVQADIVGGFALLDDVMTSLSSGAVRNPAVIGKSYCAVMSACDRSGDVRRGVEWIATVTETLIAPLGGRPRPSRSHCHLAYGSLMCTAGEISKGEQSFLEVLGRDGSIYAAHRIEAAARLATLRLTQNRAGDAGELLRTIEDRLPACEPLARLHALSGEFELAAAVARRGLEGAGTDRLRAGTLLALLVEISLAADDPHAANEATSQLEQLGDARDSASLRAEARLARGRVESARGDWDRAVTAFEAVLVELPEDRCPLLRGVAQLELARALTAAGDRGRALDSARVAASVFERLGAAFYADQANAVLRSLGGRGRLKTGQGTAGLGALTAREVEVLDLLRSGLTNAEIGARLFISAKTAEHHVGRLLTKLGVRSRAEAAAVAATAAITHGTRGGAN